jgi:hypothetical protein
LLIPRASLLRRTVHSIPLKLRIIGAIGRRIGFIVGVDVLIIRTFVTHNSYLVPLFIIYKKLFFFVATNNYISEILKIKSLFLSLQILG